jgi:uncharacterized protein
MATVPLRLRNAALLAVLVIGAVWQASAQFPSQKPQGYVSDLAGVLSADAKQQLEALCVELDQKTQAQLAVVTVQSLQGRELEEVTLELATRWGVGRAGDRGILLFLAIEDRRSRIEVGYGLEPVITDGTAGSILRSMAPYLRAGDYDGALWFGAVSLAQLIARDAGVALTSVAVRPMVAPSQPWEDQVFGEWLPIILFAIFAVFFFGPIVLLLLPRRYRRRMGTFGRWGGPGAFGGPGWGGGSHSGGGFGGFGGGSFGGGGASGRW